MSYAVLIRKKEGGRANNTTWTLETYSPENGVSSVNLLTETNASLLVVLSHLERDKKFRMVGQDGPDTFILHAVPPPRIGLRDC